MQFATYLVLTCLTCSPVIASYELLGKRAVYDPVSQIGDGQIQATTATTSAAVAATLAAVSQIGDGQIQATTATSLSLSTTTSTSKSQITMAAITQIGDGQIQATTATTSAAKTTMNAVSQIGDGQIQATTLTAGDVDSSADNSVRTVATLIGNQYSSYSASSKTVSGNLSGNLVTVTTTNTNGVTVTLIGSAVITDSAGDVSIALIADDNNTHKSTITSTSNGVLVTVVTGGANQVFNYGIQMPMVFAFIACVSFSSIIL